MKELRRGSCDRAAGGSRPPARRAALPFARAESFLLEPRRAWACTCAKLATALPPLVTVRVFPGGSFVFRFPFLSLHRFRSCAVAAASHALHACSVCRLCKLCVRFCLMIRRPCAFARGCVGLREGRMLSGNARAVHASSESAASGRPGFSVLLQVHACECHAALCIDIQTHEVGG